MAGEGDAERLVVLLEARIRDFENNMKKASGTARRNFGDMRRGSQSATRQMEQDMSRSSARINELLASTSLKIGSFAKGFAGGIVGGLTAGGLQGIINAVGDVAKGIATIGDEAKRAGLSTKAFQELKYVAEQNRVGVDSLVDGIKELNLRADEFITNGQGSAAEAFQRLGYDATTLKDKLKDPSELFTEIIGKLAKLDKAAQIRIADEVFGGTGGEKFVQLIEQGEKGIRDQIKAANDLGIVMSDELIKKADELDRKFNQVATTVGTALKTAVVEAASALQAFITEFNRINAEFEARKAASDLGSLAGSLAGTPVNPSLDAERQRLREALRLNQQAIDGDAAKGLSPGADDLAERRELQEQLRMVEDQIAAQRKLNVEKSHTKELDHREPISDAEDRATRARPEDAFPLPKIVGETPERRVDPYFGDADVASRAGKAAGESMVTTFIKGFEGFRQKAYWDVNAFRAGYGSDTTTREGGKVERVNSATMVSLADANRDLARRIAEFQSVIQSQIGGDTWASFSEEQQAALTSIAYNYGELPDRIVKAIESGNPGQIGEAIRDLGDDNGGVNGKRRSAEADLFFSGSGSGDTPAVTAAKEHKQAIEDLEKTYDQLGQVGMTALRGLADALRDGKITGEELLGIIVDVIEQLAAMPAFGGNMAGGSGMGGASIFASLLSSLFGGFREKGGPVVPGKAYLVGERRPEFFIPDQPGRIVSPGGPMPVSQQTQRSNVHVTVGVAADANGNLMPFVQSVAQKEIAGAAPGIVNASVGRANAAVVPTMTNYRKQRAGGEYRV